MTTHANALTAKIDLLISEGYVADEVILTLASAIGPHKVEPFFDGIDAMFEIVFEDGSSVSFLTDPPHA